MKCKCGETNPKKFTSSAKTCNKCQNTARQVNDAKRENGDITLSNWYTGSWGGVGGYEGARGEVVVL